MSEDEREYDKSWKPCTDKERGCMTEEAAAESERDHDWLFYKESYAASKVDRRRCQRCGLEQIMIDVGGNGQWLPTSQGMMKSGSAAMDMNKPFCHDVKHINRIVTRCIRCGSNACPARRLMVQDLLTLASNAYSRVIEGEMELANQLMKEASK